MGATVMGKHSPKMLDKTVKRTIFGPRMDEVIRKWIKLHKKEMYYVYPCQILLW
jgi:hypothetical protein